MREPLIDGESRYIQEKKMKLLVVGYETEDLGGEQDKFGNKTPGSLLVLLL